ncbi:tetratricopeptide repeat protein [Haliangium sp.]|uniref:tetratricopeptide repeat protein n=1 Tax=Haliangium sp. TaxID=2663208 RepID=UPI003D0BB132
MGALVLGTWLLAVPTRASAQPEELLPDDGPPRAQPADPYGDELADPYNDEAADAATPPTEAASAPGADTAGGEAFVSLDDAVARAIYERAVVLHAAEDYDNARMLLEEALARSPNGPVADDARALHTDCTQRLSAATEPAAAAELEAPVDPYEDIREVQDSLDPFDIQETRDSIDPFTDDVELARDRLRGRRTFILYGGALGFTLGLAAGNLDDPDTSPLVPALLGAGAGVGGSYLLADQMDLTAGQASTMAWSGAWSGMAGGILVDLAGIDTSSSTGVARGVALGGALGTVAGWFAGKRLSPTEGDVSMVNSLGLYGTSLGLLVGVSIDPVESEAYSINALVGAAVGLGAGLYLAPRLEVSRRRMLWVDLGATVGASVPWLLVYPAVIDSSSRGDEQAVGTMSALGLLGGAYLAWYWTRNMDAPDDAEVAGLSPVPGLVQRSPDGRWGLGVPVPRSPENPSLAPPTGAWGVAVDVLAGAF